MSAATKQAPSTVMVVIAFATVYIVWGSTYFFIRIGLESFPPFLLGALRFLAAGIILSLVCVLKGEKFFVPANIKPAAVTGFLLLFIGNGAVIWSEQYLPSSLAAILVSAAPLWFVVLDKPKWAENFKSKETLAGLLIGFVGVILLFYEQLSRTFVEHAGAHKIIGLILLILGNIAWCSGSLYSKYKGSQGSLSVNASWQMLAGGLVFLITALFSGEATHFNIKASTTQAWLAIVYLVVFGSLAAYSAYVWLLQVRPATQVSTYAYVNPVVAVLLGVFILREKLSVLQIVGLIIILLSVLLINLHKYRKAKIVEKRKELATI